MIAETPPSMGSTWPQKRIKIQGGSLVRPFEQRLAIVADLDGNQISLSSPAIWQDAADRR